jgi:hypothetical protein
MTEMERKNVKLSHEIVQGQGVRSPSLHILGADTWLAIGSGRFTPGDDFVNGSGSSNRARNRVATRNQTAAP